MEPKFASKEMVKILTTILQDSMNELVRSGSITPVYIIVGPAPEYAIADMPFPPEALDHNETKHIMFSGLKYVALKVKASAVVIVTDAWMLWVKTEHETPERIKLAKDMNDRGCSIDEHVAAGFGKKRECIFATMQTPKETVAIQQFYDRFPGDKIKLGERKQIVSDNLAWGGRVSIWGTA